MESLYVCEGDFAQTEPVPPGYISIWDIADPSAPKFIKRFGAGSGLPDDYLECHGIFRTPDRRFVVAQSFRSHHMLKISTDTDEIVKVWGQAEGLSLPHGLYIQ